MEKIKNYESVKENLVLKVRGFGGEGEFVNIPYFLMEDLAVYVTVCQWKEQNGRKTPVLPGITVTNEMLSEWGITKEQLFEDAKTYSDMFLPLKIADLGSMFGVEIPPEDTQTGEFRRLWICSTLYKNEGASVLAYPCFYESVRTITGYDEFFILPSSINEVMVCSVPSEIANRLDDVYHLEAMVAEVNRASVPEDEILSSQIYYFNGDGFSLARKAMGYDTIKETVKQAFTEALNKEGFENISFREMRIPKMDGRSYNGLAIIVNQPSNDFAAPTIDLDMCVLDLYEHSEETPLYVLRDCIEGVIKQIKNVEARGGVKFEDYDKVKSTIYLRSCSLQGTNVSLLANVPHIIKESFAVYPVYDICIGDSEATCIVSSKMVESWGITEEQLFTDVFVSSNKLSPMVLDKIPNTADSEGYSGWICSSSGDSGAAVLSYPNFHECVKAETGMDEFYIIPECRDYVYLVPMPSDAMSDRLNGALNMDSILKFKNRFSEARDVLSDSVLYCNKEGVFAIAKEAFA